MDSPHFDDLLKKCSLFSSLDEESRKLILPYFTRLELSKNETLFYQGDPSDSAYLLVSGRLSSHLKTELLKNRLIGYIEPGETVGELGALSSEVRSLTVKALEPSILLRIAAKDFMQLLRKHHSMLHAILPTIISRSTSLIRELASDKRHKHIVIMPANDTISLARLALKLLEFENNHPKTLILSDYQAPFSDQTLTSTEVKEKIAALSQQRKRIHRTVYILSSHQSALAKIALRRMNQLYVSAYSDSKPFIEKQILRKIAHRKTNHPLTLNLILLAADKTTKHHTLAFLQLADFKLYHHVDLQKEEELQRLFRFIRGKPVGLVLGGGGTRGYAHLGAIKALEEAKIPIDFIGGTSIGALIAGIYALHPHYETLYTQFEALVLASKNSVSWRSLTWPLISIFDAEKYTKAQQALFKDQTIEDLNLPYFCISSNLASHSEDCHRKGLLWEKVRASTSIPGLIPPMILDGELHLDGGLLNNCPADVMRELLGDQGKVIAIELDDTPLEKQHYHFSPILKLKEAFLERLGLHKNKTLYPPFIDTFLRGLFLGSSLRSKQNALHATIFVNINLSEFKMLQASPEEGARLIKIGYDNTRKLLEKTKNKNILPG